MAKRNLAFSVAKMGLIACVTLAGCTSSGGGDNGGGAGGGSDSGGGGGADEESGGAAGDGNGGATAAGSGAGGSGNLAGASVMGGSGGAGGSSGMGGMNTGGAKPMGGASGTGGMNAGGAKPMGGASGVGGANGTGGNRPVGVWTNVTPKGVSLGTYGPQTMMNDPTRPGTFYFGSASAGAFKSTDFGLTWTNISTTNLIYGCAADPNPNRNPNTPLLMICGGGYGNGVLVSTDNGVTWVKHQTNNAVAGGFGNDPYAMDIDPYDRLHIISGFHGVPGLSESFDGGVTWTTIAAVGSAQGTSNYPFFIDTGTAATTRGNWLIMSQWGDGDNAGGIHRTTNSGAAWTRTNSLQHGHGNAQIFQAGGGVIYTAGLSGSAGHGIYRSTDHGMTWARVNDGTVQNGVFATPNYLYADWGWASAGGQGQALQRSPRTSGTVWEKYAPNSGLTNGSGHASTAFDAASGKWVIVIGAWTAGIWRYLEP